MKQDYNEQYKILEDAFLRTRKDAQKIAMYEMICDKLRAMVCQFKKKHNLRINSENVEDIVQDGALWFLARYEHKDFRVKRFTSYIVYAFRKAMFNERRKRQEMHEIPLDNDSLDYL